MEQRLAELDHAVPLQGMLGYLNFAGGKSDPRFQKQLSDAYAFLARKGIEDPWKVLAAALHAKLRALRAGGSSAFRDTRQVEAVLGLVFDRVLAAYREHHRDLLFHLSDRDLLQPFFLARVFEAVLLQGAPWEDEKRIVTAAVQHLNDYIGYRPMAILETRPKGEPYLHERVRPIPLFIRDAGLAFGRYHDLIGKALEILAGTEPGILADACFDLELLDELAVDPRAYDHGHPVNRRPNYVFGEWDPHHLDNQGRYRRYVARQVTLDALLARVEKPPELDPGEALFEAAAVLAGTLLMATGSCGSSPATHDSSVTLASLMPRIARYRDAFYAQLLDRMSGTHGERLRQEAATTRQPFGGARQHLNQYLAQHRAAQLQQRQLALLFAEMGYPEASQRAAALIPTASVRLLSDILSRLTQGQLLADRGDLAEAARLLPEAEELLRRGIACGAVVDPWNVLGFQGLFPLFTAREDSIRDPRIDELVHVVEQIFNLYARLASESAAAGDAVRLDTLLNHLRRQAAWWDRFATAEIGDVRRLHGGETVASAEHVAHALARWRERGEATGDLAFWRDHLEGFQSAKAFALVVDALLRKQDYRAAMALLVNWLGQAEQVPLEDGDYSFHVLVLRWMLAYTTGLGGSSSTVADRGREEATEASRPARLDTWPLLRKFFDYLEANAEEYWQVPELEVDGSRAGPPPEDEDRALYEAAYEDVTYRDSADDNQEGPLADERPFEEYSLDREQARLTPRLRFLATVARLWQIATRHGSSSRAMSAARLQQWQETLSNWLATGRHNLNQLLKLLDAIQDQRLPDALGSYDSLVEYDRRRVVKEQLLYTAVAACLDTSMAVGTLQGALGPESGVASAPPISQEQPGRPQWEPLAIQLERGLLLGDVDQTRRLLPGFLERFRHEPLLFTALADGGQPRQILRVRIAQSILRVLVANLPRLGLLRETYQVLRTALAMERLHPAQGRGVTEFNQLFQAAFQALVQALLQAKPSGLKDREREAAPFADSGPATPGEGERTWTAGQDQRLIDLLENLTRPFLLLWVEHSNTLQLSALESVNSEEEWQALKNFIRRYGHDLFHARFMTLANLRGILHQGIDSYLDYLRDNPEPLHPVKLIDDLDQAVPRAEARRRLQLILQALVENYEEYKDYNTTTPQSDYGENLHLLLDFLRLKASYERHAWRLRPLVLAHEVLARRGRNDLAVSWQEAFTRLTRELADQYVDKLTELERTHGMRLRTVADLVQERFVRPLALDRLCALIEPAMKETRQPGEGRSFARLESELQPLTTTPTGVGLDVPHWLRQLAAEVERVRVAQSSLVLLAEGFWQVPRKMLALEDLERQIKQWQEPGDSGDVPFAQNP